MKKILVIIFIGIISYFALTSEVSAQSCEIPTTCQVNRSCPHTIAPFPCWDGTGPIFGLSKGQSALTYNAITIDDAGGVGSGGCNNSTVGCIHDVVFKNPDPATYQVKGLWWRMHDHEEGANYTLFVCHTPMTGDTCASWQQVQADGVHTSGEGCGEVCSSQNNNPHPPGDQGCPDPLPNPVQCQSAADRQNWTCAMSFDEHTWQTNACTPDTITGVKLNFSNGDIHVHLADLLWMLDGPTCTIKGSKTPDTAPFKDMKVTITDKQTGEVVMDATDQPFNFENLLANRAYSVSVEKPTGLTTPVASTACVNGTSCHTDTTTNNPAYQVGETRDVSCPSTGGFVDLQWHFAPNPTATSVPPTASPTQIPQMCRQDVALTLPAAPTPAPDMNLKLRVKFQGVLLSNIASEAWKTQPVKVTIIKQIADSAGQGSQTIFSKSFDNVQVKTTGETDAKGIAIWEGTFAASGIAPGDNYSVLVKGPKHLQRKFCVQNPTDRAEEGFPYRCLGAGTLTIGSDVTLDFASVLILAGDLPGGTANGQDGIVNAFDVSLVLNMIRNGQSTVPADLTIADMDLNGVVNAKDRGYLVETLEEKYGDDE